MEVIIANDQHSQVYPETSEEDVKIEKEYPEYNIGRARSRERNTFVERSGRLKQSKEIPPKNRRYSRRVITFTKQPIRFPEK